MAGAMRLGELTHLMESRLLIGDQEVTPTTDLFDALDGDLDLAALITTPGGPAQAAAAAPAEVATAGSGAVLPAETAPRRRSLSTNLPVKLKFSGARRCACVRRDRPPGQRIRRNIDRPRGSKASCAR
jgi:hypothetical protein